MRQLRNFTPNNSNKSKNDSDYISDTLDKYKGMNEDQLVGALMQSVAASKKNGTFNPSELENFVKVMSPQLTKEQRQKLNNLINLIKAENVQD